MYKILFFVTALCAIYCEANFIPVIIWDKSFQIPSQELIRTKRQLFGGGSFFPGGRTNHYMGGGSIFRTPNHDVSASGWRTGSSFGAGVGWTAPLGALSLSGSHTPHQTSLFSAAGSASIFKKPDHDVNIFGAHTRKLDRTFQPLSISTTGGIGYQHKTAGSLKLSGIHTSSKPDPGPFSLSGSQPPRETTSFTAEGNANILNTPDHKVNLLGSHTRKYDGDFKLLGSTSTGSVGYQHKTAGSLKLSGTHTPDSGPLSPSGSQPPRETTSFTAEGNANILNTPDHKVNLLGSHTRKYDGDFKLLGSTSTGSVGYQHKTAGSLKLSGTHTPDSGPLSPSGSQPPRETTSFTAEGSANILNTPDHKVNLLGSHTRKYDGDFKLLGSTSTGSVGYQHKTAGSLKLSGTHTPDSGPLSPSGSQPPRETTSFTAEGNANILNTPDHKVNLLSSHTRKYDGDFKLLGSTSTGSVGYQHKTAGSLKLSGTHTPDSGPLSPSGSQPPRETTSFTAEGSANILNTPDHKVNVKGSHTRKYDQNFKPVGSSSTAGVGYEHKTGLSLNLDGIHIPATPLSGSLTGKMPVYISEDGDTKVGFEGGLNFGGGKKPSSEVKVLIEKKF